MQEFKISVDISHVLAGIGRIVDREVLPKLSTAVLALAQQTQKDWMEGIERAKLWSGEKAAYGATIHIEMKGPFSAVVSSDYKYCEDIENGRPARDLKKMLQTSAKTRLSKKGKKYLIIPFRHNVDSMHKDVYALAKQLAPSRITGVGTRVSATGATVAQFKYSWGGKLTDHPMLRPRQAGMYRFDTSTGNKRSSAYMSFRVMSEDSKGWIVPPQPGLKIVNTVTERLNGGLAEKAFAEALARS
jgi:hypothetical protein